MGKFGLHKDLVSVVFADPGSDKSIPILRAPGENITIEAAYAVVDGDIAASTANYVNLHLMNGGTAGTADTGISGTAGGTAGWTANSPETISISSASGKLTDGQWLVAKYDEEGSVSPGRFTVVVEYVRGVGNKAA